MANNMFVILIMAFTQTFSADGQSTFGSCEANGFSEFQRTLLDEIIYLRNRESVCSNRCAQIEDLLERHLNNVTQTLQSFNNRLGRLEKNVQNAISASHRQGKHN